MTTKIKPRVVKPPSFLFATCFTYRYTSGFHMSTSPVLLTMFVIMWFILTTGISTFKRKPRVDQILNHDSQRFYIESIWRIHLYFLTLWTAYLMRDPALIVGHAGGTFETRPVETLMSRIYRISFFEPLDLIMMGSMNLILISFRCSKCCQAAWNWTNDFKFFVDLNKK